jgi:hypothetical protein
VAENGVAIIVGSLPGFANFARHHIFQASFYQSIRSKLSSNSKSQWTDPESQEGTQKHALWTIGSAPKRQPHYLELTESAIMNSNATRQADD